MKLLYVASTLADCLSNSLEFLTFWADVWLIPARRMPLSVFLVGVGMLSFEAEVCLPWGFLFKSGLNPTAVDL